MAAITVTAANVAKSTGAETVSGIAGEAFSAGMCVYQKSTDLRWYKAQADGTDEEAGIGVPYGIALNTGVVAQPCSVQVGGVITIGGTAIVGSVYYISATAGVICLASDLASTNKLTILAFGLTAGTLDMHLKKQLGVAVP